MGCKLLNGLENLCFNTDGFGVFLLKSVISNKLLFLFQSKNIGNGICSFLKLLSFKKAPDHDYIRKHFKKTKE